MFNTNISVKLASSWDDNQIEVAEEQKAINSGDDVSGQPEKGVIENDEISDA